MLTIVMSICLISDPSICREERIGRQISTSPQQCAMSAAPRIAEWNGEHPDWRVVRWRCSRADEKEI